jgi:ribosomal-protein-alanine N-acetyltransferase
MLNQDFLIRKMTDQDINRIMVIEVESFSLPWSKQSYISELKNDFANYLVCDYEGVVAGYGGIWVVFEEAHITNIAIARDYRGTGMGKTLMLELEKVARTKKALRILLEVRPTNEAARNMYKSLGYVDTGLRKAYYSDNGEDAILMTKFLI